MEALSAAAARLGRCARREKRLPGLLFFTDPERVPDPEGVAERLPKGSAIVFRAFGAADAEHRARRLGQIAKRRGLVLLVGADAELAVRIGADGVHLPERLAARAPRLRARHPRWIVTIAAHGLLAARKAADLGADAVVVSPIFASNSPSAAKPMGPLRLATIVRSLETPVYALGGVRACTARRLPGGVAGIAAVEALLD
jgi:thiamine-phosphate pyrophosphorylase